MLLICSKSPTIMLKFFPRITYFLPPFWKLKYKWVSASQSPHVGTSVTCGEVWGSRLSRIFLHRKSGIPISRLYLIPMYLFIYLFIYLFSIFWHISLNFSYYYAGVMLDAHASLLCSKLCRHNVDNPTRRGWIGYENPPIRAIFWPKSVDPSLFSFKSGSALRKVILWYTFIIMKGRCWVCLFFPPTWCP